MKRIMLQAIALVFVAGCGTEIDRAVTGRTLLSEARQACWQQTDDEWEAGLVILESFQEAGYSKLAAVEAAGIACDGQPQLDQSACLHCVLSMVDAIWP